MKTAGSSQPPPQAGGVTGGGAGRGGLTLKQKKELQEGRWGGLDPQNGSMGLGGVGGQGTGGFGDDDEGVPLGDSHARALRATFSRAHEGLTFTPAILPRSQKMVRERERRAAAEADLLAESSGLDGGLGMGAGAELAASGVGRRRWDSPPRETWRTHEARRAAAEHRHREEVECTFSPMLSPATNKGEGKAWGHERLHSGHQETQAKLAQRREESRRRKNAREGGENLDLSRVLDQRHKKGGGQQGRIGPRWGEAWGFHKMHERHADSLREQSLKQLVHVVNEDGDRKITAQEAREALDEAQWCETVGARPLLSSPGSPLSLGVLTTTMSQGRGRSQEDVGAEAQG